MRCLNRPDAGFTLIELLIAIVIIGVIAGIALPRVAIGNIDKARAEACKANLKQLETALDAYFLIHGHYPAGQDNSLGTLEGIKAIPHCPLGAEPYVYTTQKENQDYELRCPHTEHGFKVSSTEEDFSQRD
ncbi:MAG: prepilin-type N-terminal cleavage/methylation domain-containing protein [Firmicutes bacterium]|nr:prepilin-type N-terminal cleavage/methylation domain-containing protein [Bacillota bacterium]